MTAAPFLLRAFLSGAAAMKEKPQKQKFVEKARELGCDEDEAAFEEQLRKIVSAPAPAAKPKPEKKKPRQGKRG
jgi:hypothetical protein